MQRSDLYLREPGGRRQALSGALTVAGEEGVFKAQEEAKQQP